MQDIQHPGSSVNVSIQSILAELHKRYGSHIATLMQELSELQCAVEAQSSELTELRSKFTALSGGFNAPPPGDSIYDSLLGSQPEPKPSWLEQENATPQKPLPTIDLNARRPIKDNPQA